MTVITYAELERMRACTRPEQITDSEARRRRLKALSDEKVKSWPNTLQAMRRKKENWKIQRLAAEERGRQEIDKKEAELQKRKRAEAIHRANTIMYEQTDKMKNLRSQQMYSDVILDREEQIKEKSVMDSWQAEKERAYHEEILRQVSEAEAREKQEEGARRMKAKSIASSQYEQLEEFRGNYLERLRTEKKEGELIQKKALADLDEDEREAEEKMTKARMQMKEMQLANAALKKLKFEDQVREEGEEERRKAEMAKKEMLGQARKRLEKQRFDSRQATKQKLIDAACLELSRRTNTENRRLETQVEVMRQKEDDLEALKLRNIEKQKQAIDLSRQQQLEARLRDKEREEEEVEDMIQNWRRKNAEIDDEEASEQRKRKEKNCEIRDSLVKHIEENSVARAKSAAEQMAYDRTIQKAILEDDQRFREIADKELDYAKSLGKPTYMIEKARNARDVQLQPAMGSRI